MANRNSVGDWIFDIISYTFLTLLMIATIYPFMYVIFYSVSIPSEIIAHTGLLLKPAGLSMDAYMAVFRNPMILKGYTNTFFYVAAGVAVSFTVTSLGAYGLSRKNVYWKKPIMLLVVFSMFFNGGLIPLFLTVRDLGLIDSRWALIFPAAVNTYNLIVMRTSFAAIPDSFEESAKMDGANDFTVLIRIILPMSMPVIAVILLFYGVGQWNSWFQAAIYLQDRKLMPLQIFLREILIQNDMNSMLAGTGAMDRQSVEETVKYAIIVVATIPILLVYPFLQRFFVKGIMVGSLKG